MVKKLSTGEGEWWNCTNCFLEVQFQYLLRYPSNNRTFMPSIGSWCVVIHLSIIHVITPSWKVTFPVTQKPTPRTVFNLQASDWVHCEEETGVYYQLSLFSYKLLILKKILFKVNFARKKIRTFQKIP